MTTWGKSCSQARIIWYHKSHCPSRVKNYLLSCVLLSKLIDSVQKALETEVALEKVVRFTGVFVVVEAGQ